MRKQTITILNTLLISILLFASLTTGQSKVKRINLPNGWAVSPVGKSLPLGDLPLQIALSTSGKYLAVTNNGQSDQSIQLISTKDFKILDEKPIAKAWFGLVFSEDEKFLYASGGNDNWILKYAIQNNKLVFTDTLILGKKWPEKISPAGLAIDDQKNVLYLVTKENNSLYLIDTKSKSVTGTYPLGGEGYQCRLSPDKKELYISCWGGDKVLVFDTDKKSFSSEIKVGDNPNDLCLTKDGNYLFVANANDNSVSVIDIKERKVIETLNTALYPQSPIGSTPNSVALSEDDKMLFNANADNNCLTVFDVANPGSSKSEGFIPTGWYPTSVRVVNNLIYVANGKGFSSLANPQGPNPTRKGRTVIYQKGDTSKVVKEQYIGGLFKGTLSSIKIPDEKTLARYSKLVYENTPYQKEKELAAHGEKGNPIPQKVGAPSPIKYVFYVIKENRTYDQVLGDLPQGNGDTSLTLFGEFYTPNQHAIAKEFVLLDNFYANAEVSADGHNWSMGAYATDYLEKTWPTSYGSRGGDYDAEGNREVANNKEFIWDVCSKHNVSYRSYAEFTNNGKATIPVLENHFCKSFTEWDMKVRDTTRFYQWKNDFDSLLALGKVPQFNTLRFINDHTEGLRKGRPTPYAHVADNDLAVGLFVDYLSRSPIWKETAIFIIEDDAQDGPDHVDAHRTTAYVAGGFVKRNFVDHTMYSTSSMLRTMELILGLPPMSQYDAAAEPMWRCFSTVPNIAPFTARPINVDLDAKNTAVNFWQEKSETLDFTEADRIPDGEVN
ncbi:MAG: bifunctional YncE family protein/alkaline phosphatase family protein, partial [Ignavibacteriaceae bacterium]